MKQAATLNFLFNFYRSSSHELPFTVRTDCSHSHFLSRDCTYRSKRVHEIAMMQMFRIFLFNERKKILTIFNLPSKKKIYIYIISNYNNNERKLQRSQEFSRSNTINQKILSRDISIPMIHNFP